MSPKPNTENNTEVYKSFTAFVYITSVICVTSLFIMSVFSFIDGALSPPIVRANTPYGFKFNFTFFHIFFLQLVLYRGSYAVNVMFQQQRVSFTQHTLLKLWFYVFYMTTGMVTNLFYGIYLLYKI